MKPKLYTMNFIATYNFCYGVEVIRGTAQLPAVMFRNGISAQYLQELKDEIISIFNSRVEYDEDKIDKIQDFGLLPMEIAE